MVADFLASSGPPELVVRIYLACESMADVQALASTCCYTRSVFQSNAPIIIWTLWPREIPCFDDALIAARATKLVSDAEARGQNPPSDIQLSNLSGYHRLPGAAELRFVLNLHHLAHALDIAFWHQGGHWPLQMTIHGEPPDVLPEEPERMSLWTQRMHRAIYRTFITGAYLAGGYSEPLFHAEQRNETTIPPIMGDEALTGEQREHLEAFPAYNIASPAVGDDDLFGPLADWLLKRILDDTEGRAELDQRFKEGIGRGEICQNRTDCPVTLVETTAGGEFNCSDAHFVVWQVMQMIWAILRIEQVMHRGITNDDEKSTLRHLGHGPLEDFVGDGRLKPEEGFPRRASVVFHGVFRSEVVTMPELIERHREPTIRADPTADAAKKGDSTEHNIYYARRYFPKELTVRRLLDGIYHTYVDRDDPLEEGDEGDGRQPPLTIKFFQYFLQHYLGLRFAFDIWQEGATEDQAGRFINQFTLFTQDDAEGRDGGQGVPMDDDYVDGSEFLTPVD